jgi:hypothetical protein
MLLRSYIIPRHIGYFEVREWAFPLSAGIDRMRCLAKVQIALVRTVLAAGTHRVPSCLDYDQGADARRLLHSLRGNRLRKYGDQQCLSMPYPCVPSTIVVVAVIVDCVVRPA